MLDSGYDNAQNMIFHRALVEILNEDLESGRNAIWRKVYDLAKQKGDFHQSNTLVNITVYSYTYLEHSLGQMVGCSKTEGGQS